MSATSFNDRISRINNKTHYGPADMARGEGTATLRFSSPLQAAPTARRYYKLILMGLVLGAIIGVVAGGLEDPAMPWGPASPYNEMIILPVIIALAAAPFVAMAGCAMQARYPSFFYFAAAYFPAAITAAIV